MATEILHSDPALAAHAAKIRRLSKQTMENIVEIGSRLSECRAIFKKNGEWCAWLKDEFDWSDQTARRFIHVYEQLRGLNKLLSRKFPISALYLLAAPSTPKEARDAIIESAQAGEPVSVAEVKRKIETAKGRKPPVKRKPKATEAMPSGAACAADIGAASSGEIARIRARNEELEAENVRLRRENIALRSEVEELKARLPTAPPPADDGLDIPGYLRRGRAP